MVDYIEREEDGEYFESASDTREINQNNCTCCENNNLTNSEENLKRWSWLIDGWSNMSFKDRLSLFLPYIHYINLKDIHPVDFDDTLNDEITDRAYELCRNVQSIQFDPDRSGYPNMIIIFAPIDIEHSMPKCETRSEIFDWRNKILYRVNYSLDGCHYC